MKACSSFVSEKQMPTASTLTRTCVGRSSGTGLAGLRMTVSAATNWMARWVAGRGAAGLGVVMTASPGLL